MMKITDLAETLCDSLGLHSDLGSQAIEYLAEHDHLPDGETLADPEHAAKLLIALAGSGEMWAPHKIIERFWMLPFDRADRSTLIEGAIVHETLPDEHPFVTWCQLVGDDFGTFLTNVVGDYTTATEMAYLPGSVFIGGGPGKTSAFMTLLVTEPRDEIGAGNVNFTLDAFGGNRRPDDAPVARIERYTEVPAEIFQVIREALTGRDDKPEAVPPMEDAVEQFEQFVEGLK